MLLAFFDIVYRKVYFYMESLTMKNTLRIFLFVLSVICCLAAVSCGEHTCEFEDWRVVEEPSCTTAGLREGTCSCGKTTTEVIDPLSHTPQDPVKENEKAPDCSVAGSYDEVVKCSVCSAEISRESKTVSPLGHTPGGVTREDIKPNSCTEEGAYYEITCCSVCSTEISRVQKTVAPAHTPGAATHENITDSTCNVAGSYDEVIKCTVCETEVSRVLMQLPLAEHTPGDVVEKNRVVSTCKTMGSYDEVTVCSVCSADISKVNKLLPLSGHTAAAAVKENITDSTCTVAGSCDEVIKCAVCEVELHRSQKALPLAEHEFERESSTDASCTEAGSETYGCKNCIAEEERKLSALGHSFVDGECSVCHRKDASLGLTMTPVVDSSSGTDVTTYTITSYGSCADGEIIIPSTYEGASVTKIAAGAFSGCSAKIIVIPDSVTEIEAGAFSGVTALETLTIPFVGDSEKVGTEARQYPFGYIFGTASYTNSTRTSQTFAYSGGTSTSYFYIPNSLKNVTVTGGNVIVGAFDGCKYIESITFTGDISSVSDYAFRNTTALKTVNLNPGYTEIGSYAFSYSGIDEFTIPSGVTKIGSYAFNFCSSLLSIEIPETLSALGERTFYYCTSLKSAEIKSELLTAIPQYCFYNCSALTSVIIPDSIESIETNAFRSCIVLEAIELPESLKSIKEYAFGECKAISVITVPGSVTSVSSSAFYQCMSLVSISFGEGVETLGSNMFYLCTSLKFVSLPSTLTEIAGYVFYNCTALEEIVIPGALTAIPDGLFNGCTALKTVTLPDSAEELGDYCFNNCTSLETVNIPSSLKKIYTNTFYNCVKIGGTEYEGGIYIGNSQNKYLIFVRPVKDATEVTLSSQTLFMIPKCFSGSPVTKVIIPEGIEAIPSYMFTGATNLEAVEIPSTVTEIGSYAFEKCSKITELVIPSSVTKIGNGALSGCSGLVNLTIPFVGDSIKTATDTYQYPFGYIFGTSSFSGATQTRQTYYNSSITSTSSTYYYIPTGLKNVTVTGGNILRGAFYNCQKLEVIIIPSVEVINEYAFYNCSSLNSFTVPASVKRIGSYAFSGCRAIERLNIIDLDAWGKVKVDSYNGDMLLNSTIYTNGVPFTDVTVSEGTEVIGSAYAGYGGLESITIPASVTEISSGAFKGCKNLKEVIFLGNGLLTIGDNAFYGCTSLTDINIPTSVTEIGAAAFESVPIETLELENLKTLGSSAFYGSSLKTARLPALTSMGSYAFAYCSELDTVELNTLLTAISSSAFYMCTSLESFEVPASVTVIDSYAFTGCESLLNIEISNGLETLGSGAFSGCAGLESVDLPATVTSIGSNAFSGCSAIKSLTLPTMSTTLAALFNNSVPTELTEVGVLNGAIPQNAFKDISTITKLTLGSGITTVGSGAFSGCSGITEIHVKNIADWLKIDFSNVNASPFYSSYNSAFIYVNGEKATSVTVPEEVTAIKNYTFYNYRGLAELNMHNSVASIGMQALQNSGIERLHLPDSVTSIGTQAFSYCMSLKDVYIGNGVSKIPTGIFAGCRSIEALSLPSVGAGYSSSYDMVFGALFDYTITTTTSSSGPSAPDGAVYQAYYSQKRGSTRYYYHYYYYIPTTLKSITVRSNNIYSSAFKNMVIDSLYLTADTTADVISQCARISNHISCSPEQFGYLPTSSKYYMKSIELLGNVTSVGSGLFAGFSYLERLALPSTVSSIDPMAFDGCKHELTVDLTGNESYKFDGGCILDANNTVVVGFDASKIPDYVTNIGQYAFYNRKGLTTLVVSDALESIASTAFMGCTISDLTCPLDKLSAVYNNSVENLKVTGSGKLEKSMKDSANLKKVVFGPGITHIGADCFYNCDNLKEVVFEGCVEIGIHAFKNSSGLERVIGKISVIDSDAFQSCVKLNSIDLSETVAVGSYAFSGCSALESVTLENSATVGSRAFASCSNLTSVNFNGTKTDILGDEVFYGCPLLESVRIAGLAYGVIPSETFYNCSSLKTVEITGATKIGADAFKGCESIESFTVPSFADWFKIEFENETANPLFLGAKLCDADGEISLAEISVPAGVTKILPYAFYGEVGITSVVFNDTESIGEYAFAGTGIEKLDFTETKVTEISENAFADCKSLTEFNSGSLLDAIPNAFAGCTALERVVVGAAVDTVCANALNSLASIEEILFVDSETQISIMENALANLSFSSFTVNKRIKSIADGALSGWTSIEELIFDSEIENLSLKNIFSSVPASLKKVTLKAGDVSENTFASCSDITEITLGSGVRKIEARAFAYCTSLTTVNLSEGLYEIGDYAFTGSAVTKITLPSTVVVLYEHSLDGITTKETVVDGVTYQGSDENPYLILVSVDSSVTTVNVKAGTKLVMSNAFNSATALETITVEDGNTSYEAACGILYTVNKAAIHTVPLAIQGEVTVYANPGKLFNQRNKITSLIFEAGVTKFEEKAFLGCTGVTSLIVKSDKTGVGYGSLRGLGALEYLEIPTNGFVSLGHFFGRDSYVGAVKVTQYTGMANTSSIFGGVKVEDDYYIPASLREIVINGGYMPGMYEYSGYGYFYNCSMLTDITILGDSEECGHYTFYGCSSLKSVTLDEKFTSFGNYAFRDCGAVTVYLLGGDAQKAKIQKSEYGWNNSVSFVAVN